MSSSDNSDNSDNSDSDSEYDPDDAYITYNKNKPSRLKEIVKREKRAKQKLKVRRRKLREQRRNKKKTKEQRRIGELADIIEKEKDDCKELAKMDKKLDELEANKDDSDYDYEAELEELEQMAEDIVNKKYKIKF